MACQEFQNSGEVVVFDNINHSTVPHESFDNWVCELWAILS